jgi:hypothetical protein
VRIARHFRYQRLAGVGERLARGPIAIGAIPMRLVRGQSGARLALGHQVERLRRIRRVARQHRHGGDQLLVGVHGDGRLVSVEAFAGALSPVAHLRIVHRDHSIRGRPLMQRRPIVMPVDVLGQQPAQQSRRRRDRCVLRRIQSLADRPCHRQQPVRVGHDGLEECTPRRRIAPIHLRRPLQARS